MSDPRRAAIIRRWLAGQNAPMPSATRWCGSRKWRWRGKMPPPVYVLHA
ncbi:TilS substrate-binding domain-containing protein [Escherichia coli]